MADTDESPTITDDDDASWTAEQRRLVESYLQVQGCDHAGIGLEPRWFLAPYLALWAVRSKMNPDLVGWWAVSGDVPTDYMPAARDLRCAADVIAAFSVRWSRAADAMGRGEHVGIGRPDQVTELAPLLAKRAEMLWELADRVRAEEAAG